MSTEEPPINAIKADSITASILTCTPGEDLYAKFGHTALRVQNHTVGMDVVFNYGCFDYHVENFVLKFILGQTDYMLGAEPYNAFIYRYQQMGIGVSEQSLNLSPTETAGLLLLLANNLRPENQVYRYSWLYDNCTERARDVVEKVIDGTVVYKRAETHITVREILRECLKDVPWTGFGIDMLLGEEIDKPADRRIQMFLPALFMAEADEADITRMNGESIPLVLNKQEILKETRAHESSSFFFTPLFLFSLLLFAACILFIRECHQRKNYLWFDVMLCTLQGLAGILIAFLFFFSEHPSVNSNWLVILFNPLPLFYAEWMIYCKRKHKKNVLAYANTAIIAGFFITMLVCPQSFNTAMYIVVLLLLVRSAAQSHFTYYNIK